MKACQLGFSCRYLWAFGVGWLLLHLFGCHAKQAKQWYATEFQNSAELTDWHIEAEGGRGVVAIREGAMDIDAEGGCTVWFRQPLAAPVLIAYTAEVVGKGGKNDRVSDLNCFWMANDPRCPQDLLACDSTVRTGEFATYDRLKTYYVGYGGNNNTTTRFRRYDGTGNRPLLPEHDLGAPHLIEANRKMKVALVARGESIQYYLDGELLFDVRDTNAYRAGWFAFRTVDSHLRIDEFSITQLAE